MKVCLLVFAVLATATSAVAATTEWYVSKPGAKVARNSALTTVPQTGLSAMYSAYECTAAPVGAQSEPIANVQEFCVVIPNPGAGMRQALAGIHGHRRTSRREGRAHGRRRFRLSVL